MRPCRDGPKSGSLLVCQAHAPFQLTRSRNFLRVCRKKEGLEEVVPPPAHQVVQLQWSVVLQADRQHRPGPISASWRQIEDLMALDHLRIKRRRLLNHRTYLDCKRGQYLLRLSRLSWKLTMNFLWKSDRSKSYISMVSSSASRIQGSAANAR